MNSRQPARSHKRASLRPRADAQTSVAADADKPVENDSGLLKYFTDDVGRDVLAGITGWNPPSVLHAEAVDSLADR